MVCGPIIPFTLLPLALHGNLAETFISPVNRQALLVCKKALVIL